MVTSDSGRPSDARREARIRAAAKMIAAAEGHATIVHSRDLAIARSALDAADAVSEPTPREYADLVDSVFDNPPAPEPLTPPRPDPTRVVNSWGKDVTADAPGWFVEKAIRFPAGVYDELLDAADAGDCTVADIVIARVSESRAAALEGALRALVEATWNHAGTHTTYGPEYCDICKATTPARALLAESTP